MRNLKKILALVLALVMSISVMSVASAKFTDSDDVNAKFATAVEVLDGLKVFQGFEDGSFKPDGDITRAQVAAIIYRIDTGDVEGKQVQIYAEKGPFKDVPDNKWYAGYVNYCANAEYIKGYDAETFGPENKVTGYQALAMILRAVGYDKKGEFTGSTWIFQTAKLANDLGITKNVDADTLGGYATRELVAELLFQTIYNVEQVKYTLLTDYYGTGKTIAEERFNLDRFATQDSWGRPCYGWLADVNRDGNLETIAFSYSEPVKVYNAATDICNIVKDTGVKGDVEWWTNGKQNDEYITSTHIGANNHIAGAQGTVIEVYAEGIIVEIDTYLAMVTGTTKAGFDKNGHQYRYASNSFALFNAPVDGGVVYAADDVNPDYTKYDFWLVNYNENTGAIEPYAQPTTMDAKQTYIWWNAAKHTIDGVVYLDNVNYGAEMDDAGFDKEDAYTWFFDTFGNVIGSMEIYVPAEEAQYAVVLGAQWVNAIGQAGYAAGTLQFMNGEVVEGVKIAKVNNKAMKYAGTYPDYDPETGKVVEDPYYNFQNGFVYTTYQYNLSTEADLYLVKETDAGLELTAVGFDETAAIRKGVSRIATAESNIYYADNTTVFAFYNEKTDALDIVVGYDNLPSKVTYNVTGMDVVVNEYGFAQYIYIPAPGADEDDASVYSFKYVYITGDAMNYKLKDQFAILGTVDAAGNTDPLLFDVDYAGNEDATAAAVAEYVKLYQDMLCYVSFVNGKVVDIVPVSLGGDFVDPYYGTYYHNGHSMYLNYGEGDYYFIGTGVIRLADGRALNVNHNTVIINNGEVGEAVNNMDYIWYENLYVIYEGTTATAIFVTPTTGTFEIEGIEAEVTMADFMVSVLTAEDLGDVSASFTYDIAADADVKKAAIAEAVANGAALTMIDGLYADDVVTVTVGEIEMIEGSNYATVEVTVATEVVEKTVEIVVLFVEVEDEE